jgi:glucokinase
MIVGAVDIGGTKIAIGLVDDQNQLITKESIPTNAKKGLPFAVDQINSTLQRLESNCGVKIQGIGIACTGPVNPFTGELSVNAFLPGWEGLGLVQGLENQFHLPICVENDADAAALAECRWGSGVGSDNFMYVTVSTGIGSGLILNNHLFRGVDGSHPEMGHHTVDVTGPECFCGARGCWEIMASGPAMSKWYQSQLPSASAKVPYLDAAQICMLARQGDFLAQRTIDREAYYLGVGLANLITLFTPQRISLGGGVMKSWDLFELKVRQVIRTNCGLVPFEKTGIAFSSLGTDVNLLGAGQTWFHRFC